MIVIPCIFQFLIGFFQSLPFRLDIAVDVEEADDVDDPGAETSGGARLGADELGIKLLVLEVRFQGGDDVGVDILLVVVHQTIQKLINLKKENSKHH